MRRMKRKALFAGVVLVCLLHGLIVLYWATRPTAAPVGWWRIQIGMTLAEVEAIAGAPTADYPASVDAALPSVANNPNARVWIVEDSGAAVTFDAEQRVAKVDYLVFHWHPNQWRRNVERWLER